MRVNEFNTIDEFIYMYESGRDIFEGKFMGVEFCYQGKCYRMCREPLDEEHMIPLADGRKGIYDVLALEGTRENYPTADGTLIGWYADIYDVLDNCMIQGRSFREVIMADETEILGYD